MYKIASFKPQLESGGAVPMDYLLTTAGYFQNRCDEAAWIFDRGNVSTSMYTFPACVIYGDVYSFYYRVVCVSTSFVAGMTFLNFDCGAQPIANVGLMESKHGIKDTYTTAVDIVRITSVTGVVTMVLSNATVPANTISMV